MRRLLLSLVSIIYLQAEGQDLSGVSLPGANDTSEGSPLFQLASNLDWEYFGRSLSISGSLVTCTYKDDITFGFKASVAAPVAIIETKQDYGYSISLEANVLGTKPTNTGVSTADGGYVHVHAYGFNPLGEFFKENTGGMLCLPNRGPMFTPLYFSELPLSFCNDDIKSGNMFADIVAMINPITILSGIVDCVAAETHARRSNTLSDGWKNTARLISGKHFLNGCQGSVPINCKTTGSNQIGDAVLQATRVMSLLHRTGVFKKTANFGIGDEPWCGSKEYLLFPKAQYQFQIAYPTVGKTHQFGISSSSFSNFSNKIATRGATALYVWQISHYSAGGSRCD